MESFFFFQFKAKKKNQGHLRNSDFIQKFHFDSVEKFERIQNYQLMLIIVYCQEFIAS